MMQIQKITENAEETLKIRVEIKRDIFSEN